MPRCKANLSPLWVMLLTVFAVPAQAQTNWYVDVDNCPGPGSGTPGDPFCTIQDGIDAADGGDTVWLADGLYFDTGNVNIDYGGEDITVKSTSDDPESCIVSGAGLPVRPFHFRSREGRGAKLEGVGIWEGDRSDNGGGVLCTNWSSPTITNCVFSANTANRGGGLYCENLAHPKLNNCEFRNNVADSHGGALYVDFNASITLTDCEVLYNSAGTDGGGIYCANAPIATTIAHCDFLHNWVVSGNGGAAYFAHGGNGPTVTGCYFYDNRADAGNGGAVYAANHTLLTDCIFTINSALNGGGIACEEGAWPELHRCTFSENQATALGGAMYADKAFPAIHACTIAGNSAQTYGGAIYAQGAVWIEVNSSKITNNTAPQGAGIYATYETWASQLSVGCCTFTGNSGGGIYVAGGSSTTVANTIIAQEASGDGVSCDGTSSATLSYTNLWNAGSNWGVTCLSGQYPGNGNLSEDPVFVNPAADLHLDSGSPCIDAGDNGSLRYDYDVEGNDRVLDGDGDGTATTDMGAYEYPTLVPPGQNTTVNPGGGSGDPTEDALVYIENNSASDATITVSETTEDLHPGAGGSNVIGITLVIETSLGVDELFMRVSIPFDADDLDGQEDPLTADLVWFDGTDGIWALAVTGNTEPSPGTRFAKSGPATLDPDGWSDELGDYGVFWNTLTLQGYVWANLDHASDFTTGITEGGEAIPTVSVWGMLAMTLLLLAAGTVVLKRAQAGRC